MSKHQMRHARAYAAGGRDACEQVKATLSKLVPEDRHKAELGRVIDNIRQTRFPMPAPNDARKGRE